MNIIKKIIGIIFLMAGSSMLTLAYVRYDSLSVRAFKLFKGGMPDKVLYLAIGGGVCTIIGIYRILKARR